MQQTIFNAMISLYYKLNLMYVTYNIYSYWLTLIFQSSYNSSENLEEERRDLIAQIEDLRYQLSTSQEQLLVSEQKIKESEVHNN